jgi:glycosyltransferase involved in cell wall biosynthesis
MNNRITIAPLAAQLRELPRLAERAIIINCSTKAVTTLALLSALKYANMPVLLIDCESTDGSVAWFEGLRKSYTFDFLRAPLRPHGETLDVIFGASNDDAILLVDSDLEILRDDVVPEMRAALTDQGVYGAGFLHEGASMAHNGRTRSSPGRYMERMWIPLTFLKTAAIRRALRAGSTFMHSRDYLEFPWSRHVSKLLYVRHRLPLVKHISLEGLASARERIHGEQHAFREYDTGARIHSWLTQSEARFASVGEPFLSQSLKHYHGVTRATLTRGQANATPPNAIETEVNLRLKEQFNVAVG